MVDWKNRRIETLKSLGFELKKSKLSSSTQKAILRDCNDICLDFEFKKRGTEENPDQVRINKKEAEKNFNASKTLLTKLRNGNSLFRDSNHTQENINLAISVLEEFSEVQMVRKQFAEMVTMPDKRNIKMSKRRLVNRLIDTYARRVAEKPIGDLTIDRVINNEFNDKNGNPKLISFLHHILVGMSGGVEKGNTVENIHGRYAKPFIKKQKNSSDPFSFE